MRLTDPVFITYSGVTTGGELKAIVIDCLYRDNRSGSNYDFIIALYTLGDRDFVEKIEIPTSVVSTLFFDFVGNKCNWLGDVPSL